MATPKTHIMRWAPQDWRTSRVRMRSAMTGERDLRLVYLEVLNALHEHGGRVSSDPEVLSDDLLLPADVISKHLPVLIDLGRRSDGGLVDNGDGTLSNRRVLNDLAAEQAFRRQQAELGARGAKAKANAKRSLSVGSANAKRRSSPPAPSPTPTPSPTPACPPTPHAGATDDAGTQADSDDDMPLDQLPAPNGNGQAGTPEPGPEPNRLALVARGNGYIRELAALTDRDPTEVLAEASSRCWGGLDEQRFKVVNLAGVRSPDYLARIVHELGGWIDAAHSRCSGNPAEAWGARASPAPQQPRGAAAVMAEAVRRIEAEGG